MGLQAPLPLATRHRHRLGAPPGCLEEDRPETGSSSPSRPTTRVSIKPPHFLKGELDAGRARGRRFQIYRTAIPRRQCRPHAQRLWLHRGGEPLHPLQSRRRHPPASSSSRPPISRTFGAPTTTALSPKASSPGPHSPLKRREAAGPELSRTKTNLEPLAILTHPRTHPSYESTHALRGRWKGARPRRCPRAHGPGRVVRKTPSSVGRPSLPIHKVCHGYIGFGHDELPADGGFTALAWASTRRSGRWWISPWRTSRSACRAPGFQPNNADDKDTPLAPEGTLARKWKERGPTWGSVFQTVEGGTRLLGRQTTSATAPPKFSMNATPQCYDYEVGSPGWAFFHSNEALARSSPRHCATEQPLADSSRWPAIRRQAQRRVPRLYLDGAALYGTDDGRSADRRAELDLLPHGGPTSKARSPTTSPRRGARSASCSTTRLSTVRGLDARPGKNRRRRDGDQHRAAPFDSTDAKGTDLFEAAKDAIPGRCRRPPLTWSRMSPITRKTALYDDFKSWARMAAQPAPGN